MESEDSSAKARRNASNYCSAAAWHADASPKKQLQTTPSSHSTLLDIIACNFQDGRLGAVALFLQLWTQEDQHAWGSERCHASPLNAVPAVLQA